MYYDGTQDGLEYMYVLLLQHPQDWLTHVTCVTLRFSAAIVVSLDHVD